MLTRTFWFVLCLGVLALHAPGGSAAERKSLAEEIDELARLIEAGNKIVDKAAARISKHRDASLDALMALFRSRRKGGLGVGQPIKPDGIEAFLLSIERPDRYKPEWQKPALQASCRLLAVLLVLDKFVKASPSKNKEAFENMLADALKEAGSFRDALKQNKATTVRDAASRLSKTCTGCHVSFRPMTRTLALEMLKKPVLGKDGKFDDRFLERLDLYRQVAPDGQLFGGRDDKPENYDGLEDVLIKLVVEAPPQVSKQGRDVLRLRGLAPDKLLPVLRPSLESLPSADGFHFMQAFRGVPEEKLAERLGELVKEKQFLLHVLPVIEDLNATATIPEVRKLLDHDNFQVRSVAEHTLARMGGLSDIADLIEALHSEDAIIRGRAALALSRKGKEAIEPLRAVLKEKDRAVRCSAIYALGAIGKEAKEAVPDLVALQEDKDKLVQLTARQALRRINADD